MRTGGNNPGMEAEASMKSRISCADSPVPAAAMAPMCQESYFHYRRSFIFIIGASLRSCPYNFARRFYNGFRLCGHGRRISVCYWGLAIVSGRHPSSLRRTTLRCLPHSKFNRRTRVVRTGDSLTSPLAKAAVQPSSPLKWQRSHSRTGCGKAFIWFSPTFRD